MPIEKIMIFAKIWKSYKGSTLLKQFRGMGCGTLNNKYYQQWLSSATLKN